MNKIHDLSHITTLADYDLFTVPPTQLTIEKNIVTEYRPISTLNPDSVIEFQVNSAVDEYILLRETQLYIKIRVDLKKSTGANAAADDWKKLNVANNLMHSLFRTVELEIEGKSVTQSPQTYAYKAYFETMLGFCEEAKDGYLCGVTWYNDEDKKEKVDDDIAAYTTPKPMNTTGKGEPIDMLGKLHLDLAFQPRALIGGCRLKFTLVPNNKAFYLNHDSTVVPTVTFENAALYVTKSKVAYPIVEAHNLALTKGTAKYPIMRSLVKSFTVPTGLLDVNIDNAITGQIPRRMFLALVDSRAYTGTAAYNPYNFTSYNLNYLVASVDGVQYPTVAFTPDYTEGLYVREFMSLYDSLNQMTTDACLALPRGSYPGGNCIYGFSFAPDPTDDSSKTGYVNPTRYGSVRLSLKFAQALANNINVLIYCEYDNIIEIDATRTPFSAFF